jgi:two-component system sensor histidine kinase/response regulator
LGQVSDRPGASPVLLSLLPATPGQRRLALGVACLLVVVFLTTLPFARIGWLHLPAFVLVQKTLMLVSDLITAALLFGQYSIGRSHALNILAGGYLFTALIVVPHALTFPEVLSQTGLLGAGPQTAAYLYIAAHGVLPLTIIAATLQRQHAVAADDPTGGVIGPIAGTVLAVILGVVATTLLVTRGHQLPPLIDNGYYTIEARIAVGALLVFPPRRARFARLDSSPPPRRWISG